MSTHQIDPRNEIPAEIGYETSDVSLGVLVKWIIALFVFVGISSIVALGIYFGFEQRETGKDVWPSATGVRHVPSEDIPVVQSNPVLDIRDFRTDEDNRLQSYGWVDQSAGRAKIPVERSLDIIAQKGLPDKVDDSKAETYFPAGAPTAAQLQIDAPSVTGAVK